MGNYNEYNATISNEVCHKIKSYNPIIKTKGKYFGIFSDNIINIYNLNPPNFFLTPEKTIISNYSVNYLDFNPDYPEIIISALYDGDVKLWNISNKENNNEICTFKGHYSSVKYCIFNPKISTNVISSDKNSIKLWDLNEYTHEYNIFLKKDIKELKWNFSGDIFGYINSDYEVIINKRENDKDLFIIKDKKLFINDFIFKDENKVITFHDDKINIWDIRNTTSPNITYYNTKISEYLYDSDLKYFYSLDNNKIGIYDVSNFSDKIQEITLSISNDGSDLILLDSCFLEGNEISNILKFNKSNSRLIKITKKNKPIYTKVKKESEVELNRYLENIVYKISDYSEYLRYNKNIKSDEEIIIKQRYLNIPEISSELKSLQNQSLLERKEYVKIELNKKYKFKDLREKYFFYLKLLIRDNTNTKLIKKYLAFLKENQRNKIISSDIDYNNELKYYLVCLSKAELNEFHANKEKSEIDILIEFLAKLNQVNSYLNFHDIKELDIKKLNNYSYFNQPIELNNMELFFYKLKMNLFFNLKKIRYDNFKEKFIIKKAFIKKILENNFFKNEDVIKKEELLNLVIFSIININDKNNDLYNNFLDFIITKNNINKYEQKSEEMKSEISINDIKKFLNVILKGTTIKRLMKFLFGNNYYLIFTDKYINGFIENYLKFVPFKGVDFSGMTDRFTLRTYIFMDQQIENLNIDNQNDKEQITKALKIGRSIIIILHELCHNFYSYLLQNFNYNNLPFERLEKEFLKIREGGFYSELVLFGRIVNEISLEEALFLLNEDSYMKSSLKTFQKDFITLQDGNKVIGIFSCFNKIRNNKNYSDYKNISISTKHKFVEKPYKKSSSIKIRMNGNCVMGSNRIIDVDSMTFLRNIIELKTR